MTILKTESKLALWFTTSKHSMPNNMDLTCGVIHIPSIGSKFAHPDPYLELQNDYNKFCTNTKNILLFGDFNTRTATHPDVVQIDNFICDVYGNDELLRENLEIFRCFENYNVPLERKNIDKTSNGYGQQLSQVMRKCVLCHMRTTKAQISLRIRAV